jgi:hypothetical protein
VGTNIAACRFTGYFQAKNIQGQQAAGKKTTKRLKENDDET